MTRIPVAAGIDHLAGTRHRILHRLERSAGGGVPARAVVLFACVLGLESADLAAVGACGPQLEAAFHISNAQLGLLAAISTIVGAVATVPAGALTDRVRRTTLLAGAVALWGVSMAAAAAAPTYGWLLLARLGLGAVTAAAGPAIASLTGDLFAPSERGRIYGYILSGELLGAGVGFVVSGEVASALSWRWAFAVLVLPAALLAFMIWRRLPEPERGRQTEHAHNKQGVARRAVARHHIDPDEDQVLREDPDRMPLRRAIVYVLGIRTNRWLIIASAIGYFFFAGLRTFVLVFVRGHFALAQTTATAVLFVAGLGAVAGVLIVGRLADRMIRSGTLNARVLLGALCYLVAPIALIPGLLLHTLVVAVPALMLAAAALGAPNPPLDAARLDIMPARLWGRAEGVRTLLRQTAQAGAPLLFGVIADALGGGHVSTSASHVSAATTRGLQYAFLIMLVPLAVNGLLLLRARHLYLTDVATAIASERTASARRRGQTSSAATGMPPRLQSGGSPRSTYRRSLSRISSPRRSSE